MGNKRRLEVVAAGQEGEEVLVQAKDLDGPPKKKQLQRRSLFLRSLDPTTTTEALIEHFSQSFPIKHATAVKDPKSGQCRGYGFVTFADAEDAERALAEFNGSILLGKKIKAEIAEPRNREIDETLPVEVAEALAEQRKATAANAKEQRRKETLDQNRAPKLIVRNLPWSIKTPEQLEKLFLSYGKIIKATIPTKKPGLMPGFGFVLMRGKKNAQRALDGVNGKEIDGRTLAVDWAVDKDVWEKSLNSNTVKEEDLDDGGVPLNGDVADIPNVEDSDNDESDSDEAKVEDEEDDEENASIKSGSEMDSEDEEAHLSNQDKLSQNQDYSTVLFIRNLPFTTTDEDLQQHFTTHFGRVRYARTVLDHTTERPRGTAFVSFADQEIATACLRGAPSSSRLNPSNLANESILQSELDDPSGKYTISGRILQLSRAVPRDQATKLASDAKQSRNAKDKRRLYLLNEGTIGSGSPLYELLSQTEVGMREASTKQRKQLVKTNPALHLSLTRLSIRNMPRSVGSKELKALARSAVVGFAKDVKEGKRQRLSKEELARGGDEMVAAEKQRKKRGKGIVKQAKVVYEDSKGSKVSEKIVGAESTDEPSGSGRSRGYGFIEYYTHRAALMGLRWLNGHAVGYEVAGEQGKNGQASREIRDRERQKRLIVEFAIENVGVTKRRHDKQEKARGNRGPNNGTDELNGQRLTHAEQSLFDTADAKGLSGQRQRDTKGKVTKSLKIKGAAKAKVEPVDKAKEKLAQRQRIINKKRAVRRERKRNAA